MDQVTSEIINISHTLKKLIYAREKFTDDEKLLHALAKARASLIRLDKTINNSNAVKFHDQDNESKLKKVLFSDVSELLHYEIPLDKIIPTKRA
ncbi:MAG: hypothetical protein HQL46_00745 [Gammaproteobacteria bacterium]|nr:hypothetical protein [Gammaproteobacteria bacterium]